MASSNCFKGCVYCLLEYGVEAEQLKLELLLFFRAYQAGLSNLSLSNHELDFKNTYKTAVPPLVRYGLPQNQRVLLRTFNGFITDWE